MAKDVRKWGVGCTFLWLLLEDTWAVVVGWSLLCYGFSVDLLMVAVCGCRLCLQLVYSSYLQLVMDVQRWLPVCLSCFNLKFLFPVCSIVYSYLLVQVTVVEG